MAWSFTTVNTLAQGDILPACQVPVPTEEYNPDIIAEGQTLPFHIQEYDLIVMTQSCDLDNNKVRHAALCPIVSHHEMEQTSPGFTKKIMPNVRAGRVYSLYLLQPFPDAYALTGEFIVDFREIYTLPVTYLKRHASNLGNRLSLLSPYREHLSSAFGGYFSRVALP